ncbi:hypothetical protein [Spiroplasma sp. BIUS-1]|uniref:hypothetical protein n=1 Tax=Spiroplasma sp. BIUS-1 TaxID=216964 RepID=UPI0013997708|nr:hypothetical protein [Spiroplasma sp. BIUS-1]QHX36744.1 hypothetical protein SBIUS_v1c04910 [Spiroplasma sp. BIUS-1]
MKINGDKIEVTSEKGIQVYSGINDDTKDKLTLESSIADGDLSFTTSYKTQNGTYYLKDDRSSIGYSRGWVAENTINVTKALENSINAAASRKQAAEALVEGSNGQINLNEAYKLLPDEKKFETLNTSSNFNNWYKEMNIDLTGSFVKSGNSLKVSNSDKYIFEVGSNDSISTSVRVQHAIISGDDLTKVYDDVDKQLGGNLKVERQQQIDLSGTTTSVKINIKAKDGLLLPSGMSTSKEIDLNFSSFGNVVVEGELPAASEEIVKGAFVGETFDYTLKNFNGIVNLKNAKGLEIADVTPNGTDTTVKLKVKNSGKVSTGFDLGKGYETKASVSLTAYSPTISVKGLGSSVKVKEGKEEKFKVENAHMFSAINVNVGSNSYAEGGSNSSQATAEYKDGYIIITGGKSGEAVDLTINATPIRAGVTITPITTKLTIFTPKPFPLWLLILLLVLLVLLLSGFGYFIWWKFFRSEFQKRQPRYAAIAADKHAVAKAKKTETAKITRDKGIVRSGLFERELEYNLDKLNDPDYESKYVWINEGKVEDTDPVLNNWDSKKSGTRSPNKKDPQLESRLQNVKKNVKK